MVVICHDLQEPNDEQTRSQKTQKTKENTRFLYIPLR